MQKYYLYYQSNEFLQYTHSQNQIRHLLVTVWEVHWIQAAEELSAVKHQFYENSNLCNIRPGR